jgi:hypothetical protein
LFDQSTTVMDALAAEFGYPDFDMPRCRLQQRFAVE